eukprot:TRINITY_DN799_c0_g1_i1.p1 TRINITY_DN799_c0_g1~~TRINITY_DN799_c0_g1_i1.p1  ORF type:complete len:458 (+),score=97.45 TRINITY_DN799_c0_g1_i1:66-1439(+)
MCIRDRCGIPENLIQALVDRGTKDLTIVSDNGGTADGGPGLLLRNGRVKKMISSFLGVNPVFSKLYLSGELELELVPQGTLAERIRAGGAGIPAFYTPTGVGTLVQKGGFPVKVANGTKASEIMSKPRESAVFDGKEFILERAIKGDFALVKARKADTLGNLVFHRTARNFNPDMATAARCTVAEVEEIVPAGSLNPDEIHLPSVYVDRVYQGKNWAHRIENLVFDRSEEQPSAVAPKESSKEQAIREKIAKRAAQEMKDGMYVNLGIGIPTLIPKFLPKNMRISYQSENGMLGMGNYPKQGQEDSDLINAGKEPITETPGCCYFQSSQSFAMIRGGHLDLTVLGAMQVSKRGDIANWVVPGKLVKGMGGAMDLVGSGSRVIVVMKHTAKNQHKILEECTLPLTGQGVVNEIITELAVFKFAKGELVLAEIAEGVSIEEVQKQTGCGFVVANDLKTF